MDYFLKNGIVLKVNNRQSSENIYKHSKIKKKFDTEFFETSFKKKIV